MRFVNVEGLRTYVEGHGSGPPLVLVHGLGGSTELWRFVADDLARDFRVVAYDLRGCGRSAVPSGPYTMGQLVVDLDGVLTAVGLEHALLMGHSLGGGLVLAYAAKHPERVLGVVGVGAVVELPDQARQGMRGRAETVELRGMAAVAEMVATNGMAPSFRQTHQVEFGEFVKLLESCDPGSYAALCRVVADIDVVADLTLVRAPVLLLGGELDLASPPAANEATASRLRGARFVQIPDCAHIVPWEKPRELLTEAVPFLQKAAEAGPGAGSGLRL
jgi:pimeloyl-ACP methyl ester carboxylesterase